MKDWLQSWRSLEVVALTAAALASACADDTVVFEPLPGAGTSGAAGSGGGGGARVMPLGASGAAGAAARGGAGGVSTAGTRGMLDVAGRAGSGGAPSAMGGAGMAPATFACAGVKPTHETITSFDDFDGSAWKSPGNVEGGVYVYPEPLTPAQGDFLRFDDQVGDATGMGVWFSDCVDASQFAGVRFTAYGRVGKTGVVQVYLVTNRDKDVLASSSIGACVPKDPNNPWSDCRPPAFTLRVTSEPQTYTLAWSDFKDGLPSSTSDGSDILDLQWSFDWSDGVAPFAAELTIDDLVFVSALAP
jgi:hypothetical protein